LNSKPRGVLKLGQKGNCSIRNYLQTCQVWKFLDFRKVMFCIFKFGSIEREWENTWILEKFKRASPLGSATRCLTSPRLTRQIAQCASAPGRPRARSGCCRTTSLPDADRRCHCSDHRHCTDRRLMRARALPYPLLVFSV
jgi:hypothetical protein